VGKDRDRAAWIALLGRASAADRLADTPDVGVKGSQVQILSAPTVNRLVRAFSAVSRRQRIVTS